MGETLVKPSVDIDRVNTDISCSVKSISNKVVDEELVIEQILLDLISKVAENEQIEKMSLPVIDVDVNVNVVSVDNVSEDQTPTKLCPSSINDEMNVTRWETPPTTTKKQIDDDSLINGVNNNTFTAVLDFNDEIVVEDESTVKIEGVECSPATSNSSSFSSEMRTVSSSSDNFDNFKKPFTPQRYADNLSEHEIGSKEEFSTQFVDDLETLEKLSNDGQKYKENGKSYLRKSLYRNFDPLVQSNKSFNDVDGVDVHCTPKREEYEYSKHRNSFSTETPMLMNFNTPLTMKSVKKGAVDGDSPSNCIIAQNASPKPDVLLSATSNKAEETIKMLRLQELSLQEQIIKKDQEICKLTAEKESYKQKCSDYFAMISSMCSSGIGMMHSFRETVSDHATEKQSFFNKVNAVSKERDQALEDVQGVENSFSELHRRYEKMKAALELAKQNEEIIRRQCFELQEKLKEKDDLYEELRLKADSEFYNANALLEKAKKSTEREITVLKAQLKKAEMKVNGLQSQIDQKNEENLELTQMVDELTKLKC